MAFAPVTVRAAVKDDAAQLAQLRWAFRSELAVPTEERTVFLSRCMQWMRDALSPHGTWRAWLAEAQGRVWGTIWLDCISKMPTPVGESETHAYLSNLYVEPSMRGRSIGQALLDAAMAHCHALHPHTIIVWPSERSRPLYARAGFSLPRDIMACPIGGRPLDRDR